MKAYDSHYEQPTPRRPLAAPTPSSPQERPGTPNSPDGELRELLSNKFPAFLDDPHKRPLTGSTEAGPSPSPSPEDIPPRPQSVESVNSPLQRYDTCSAQARKIFIGGVPQDVTNTDLYNIFTVYGSVKKAWLQKCRSNHTHHTGQGPQNHRGFGFAIFHEASSVDNILGTQFSRFINLWDGRKLEVKRAVSSNNIGEAVRSTGSARGGSTVTPMPSATTAPMNPAVSATVPGQQVGYARHETQPKADRVFEETYSGTGTVGSIVQYEVPFLHQPQPRPLLPQVLNAQAVPFRAPVHYQGQHLTASPSQMHQQHIAQLHQQQRTPPPPPLPQNLTQNHIVQLQQQHLPGTPTHLRQQQQPVPGTPTHFQQQHTPHHQQQPQGPVDVHQVLQQLTGVQTVQAQPMQHQPQSQQPQPLAPQELAAMLLRAQPECYDD